jgi:hypothetical protein
MLKFEDSDGIRTSGELMNSNKLSFLVLGIVSFGAICFVGQAIAAPMVFTVDDTQSQVTLSGKIAGYALTTQGAGSLTTTYSGNINADVTGSTIQFTGSSDIIAKTNGVWQPAVGGASGSALADYGGKASLSFLGTGYGAARNIVLDLNSPLLTLTGTNFDSTALVFSFAAGSDSSFDYFSSLKHGTLSLTGNSTNSIADGATLSTNGNVLKLIIQINAQFAFTLLAAGDTPLVLTGQIVATNALASPLVISSIALTKQNVVLTVENATESSQLQISTNLQAWLPASTTVSNYSGSMIFTTPLSGPQSFFRVQQ